MADSYFTALMRDLQNRANQIPMLVLFLGVAHSFLMWFVWLFLERKGVILTLSERLVCEQDEVAGQAIHQA